MAKIIIEAPRQGVARTPHIGFGSLHNLDIDSFPGVVQLNKIMVFRDCEQYLDEKRTFARELDDMNQPTEKIANEARYHLMACERTLMANFTSETAVGLTWDTSRSMMI